jgi:PAS domain S-box-containing protein
MRASNEKPGSSTIAPALLIEALPLVAYATDTAGRVTRVNRRWLEYTGFGAEQSLGLSGTDAVHPNDLPLVLKAWAEAIKDLQPYRLEYRLKRVDGEYRWHLGNAEPVFDMDGAVLGWIGTATDVHELKTRQPESASLRLESKHPAEHEGLFAQLIDNAPFGVYLIDADYKMRSVNISSKAVFGGVDPLIGRDIREVLHLLWDKSFADEVFQRFQRTMETGVSFVSAPITEQRHDRNQQESYDWQIHRIQMPDGRHGVVCYFYDLTALKSAEDRLRLGVHLADLSLAEVDYTTNQMYLSEQAAALYGFGTQPMTVTRDQVHATFHPDDRQALDREIERSLDPNGSGLIAYEHRIVHPDGDVRWLNVRKQVFFDHSINPPVPVRALLAAQDITTRKREEANLTFIADLQRAYARLSKAEDILRYTGEHLVRHLGISHCLFIQVGRDEREVTAFFEQRQSGEQHLLGTYKLEDFLTLEERTGLSSGEASVVNNVRTNARSKTAWDRFAGLGIASMINAPFVSDGRWRFMICAHHDRPRIWRNDEVQLVRELATRVYPRLERAWAEARLRESETRFRSVFENAAVGMAEIDSHTGRFLRTNRRFTEIAGYPAEDMLELDFQAITHPDDLDADLAHMERLRAGEIREFTMEKRYIQHGGAIVWINLTVSALWAPGAAADTHIAIIEDITERKRAEAHRQEINENQRRFVSDAAHELRAPLTAIQGNLELIQRYPNISPTDREDALSDAAREAARLGRLVSDMLALARGDAGGDLQVKPVRLDQVLEHAFNTARPLATQHRLERGDLPEITIEGHQDRLAQLALILLENALKYTPPNGTVKLELNATDDYAEFRVIDNGLGIAKDDLERVFERFYRADKSRSRGDDPGGTGLGLPIAKWIVQQHGGKIWLESELGRGTTAVVRLPRLKKAEGSN